jgi:DNA-binding transcriptional LysR family regulator
VIAGLNAIKFALICAHLPPSLDRLLDPSWQVRIGLCSYKCQNALRAALAPGQNITLASTYVIAMQAALNCAGRALTHEILVRDYLENGTLVAPFQTKLTLNNGYYLLPMA